MKQKITYWIESDGKYLGYLNEFPDHWTQGDDFEDLKDHLKDLYHEFSKGDLPGIKKVEEIEVG
jgi:predicted RNase H-like HicB family nuclease